jgi:16S rRNA (cytidine1402-2'-O)-methyltransferase
MPVKLDVSCAFMVENNHRGTLYLVGTPIGNLEDISFRAIRTLKEAQLIACEDTRQTQKLLNHYSIETPSTSYHEHNELTKSAELVMQLEQGKSIALVTDAGMPGISDPGFRLVTLAIRHRIPVVPIPGPSAFLSALVASGLPTDAFRFLGFLPSKEGQRAKALENIRNSTRTVIFYEAPHRVVESVEEIVHVLGPERPIVVAREVTKLHEEFIRGTAAEVLSELKHREEVRGEITLLIGRAPEQQRGESVFNAATVRTRVRELMKEESLDERDALKRVAKEMGVSKSEAYREFQKTKS